MGSCCSSGQPEPNKTNTRPEANPKTRDDEQVDDQLSPKLNEIDVGDSARDVSGIGEYTSQCIELQQRLVEFCNFYNNPKKINQKSLLKIWEKLDRKKRNKLTTEKEFPRLIYAMFGIFIKSKNRHQILPKKADLNALIIDMVNDIKPHLQDQDFITKEEFTDSIGDFLKHTTYRQTQSQE